MHRRPGVSLSSRRNSSSVPGIKESMPVNGNSLSSYVAGEMMLDGGSETTNATRNGGDTCANDHDHDPARKSSGNRILRHHHRYHCTMTVALRFAFCALLFSVGWLSHAYLMGQPQWKEQDDTTTSTSLTEPKNSVNRQAAKRLHHTTDLFEQDHVALIFQGGRTQMPVKSPDAELVPTSNHQQRRKAPVPSRIFPVFPHPFPCLLHEAGSYKKSPTNTGFLYVKEMKAASTTLAGITWRIARNVASRHRTGNDEKDPSGDGLSTSSSTVSCQFRNHHMRARKYGKRDRSQSFLWSMVRQPNDRMVSKFYHFAVSRQGYPSTNFTEYYHEYDIWIYDQAYYLKSLYARERSHPRNPPYYWNETEQLLEDFDFLGVTERFDESLAVLQLLLGLETGDMLYINAKEQNSYEYYPNAKSCIHLEQPAQDDAVAKWKTYLESSEWKEYTAADVMIYEAINASLDLTIDALGRSVVDRTVRKLQVGQRVVAERCKSEGANARVFFPCDANGRDQRDKSNCLREDIGCGYECLDQVERELSNHPEYQAIDMDGGGEG